jgi:hypothetical protein
MGVAFAEGPDSLLSVADQLFFVAHDDRYGRPRLHQRAVALGLAGALLGELVLLGRVDVFDGTVYVVRREPPHDALAHSILSLLVSQPQHRDVRTWLSFLAESAIDDVARRLVLAGLVREHRQRRLVGSKVGYLPTDANLAAWQPIRLERLLNGRYQMSPKDGLLVGLVAATGLTRHVLWDTGRSAAGFNYLPHVLAGLPGPLHALVSFTEMAVGQTVLAPR